MTTIAEMFKKATPHVYVAPEAVGVVAPKPNLLYGVELEIENASFDWEIAGIRATEDGSLRNRGVEFITMPMTLPVMMGRLNDFFEHIAEDGFDPGSNEHYSDRTSIHVHTNCLDLTIEQVTSILLLYQVVESLLFKFIGHDRDKNIFCVPWSQTTTSYNTLDNLPQYIKHASIERNKYTALNLTPLKDIGTIEWRHMAGECDLERIETWLTLIGHFYRIATSNNLVDIKRRLLELNTTSHYDLLLSWLFQDKASVLYYPGYKEDLENGVLDMKYSIINEGVKSKPKLEDAKSIFGEEHENFQVWLREAMEAQAQAVQIVRNRAGADAEFRWGADPGVGRLVIEDMLAPQPEENVQRD